MSVRLDLRGTRCPMNLVRAKLALEPLAPGDELELVMDPGEGFENVPRALASIGHHVVVAPDGDPPTLLVRKKG